MGHFFPVRFLLILFLKAACIAAVVLFAGIQLGPDEAQYWTWSRALDWGYYSKPPGIAWQIWMGTQLFGNSEWGVRSFSIVIGFFQAYAVYLLALRSGLAYRTAFWCGLFIAFSPLGIFGSFFAVTDGGFLLCWTGALLSVVSGLSRQKGPDPLIVGAWVLAGALFKWPIYLFWVFYSLAMYWYFPTQSKWRLSAGIGISLLGLLPSLWWNAFHHWATFRHVFATLQGGSGAQKAGSNLLEFIGAQAFLVSPILFILLIASFVYWMRQRKNISPPLYFCGFVTLASLGIAVIAACFQKIQGNWIVFAYPSAFVLLGWYVFMANQERVKWAKIGFAFSIACGLLFAFLPAISSHLAFPHRLNPLKHNLGWSELQVSLDAHGYDSSRHFLAGDKYQTASILSFYNNGQKRAYFLNLQDARHNQFSYWPSLQDEQKGAEGYFIWVENEPYLGRDRSAKLDFYQHSLIDLFEKVEFLEFVPLIEKEGTYAKGALLFRCSACKKLRTPDSHRY